MGTQVLALWARRIGLIGPATLLVAGLAGVAQAAPGTRTAAAPALETPRPVSDTALPPRAKPGTGMTGQFNTAAFDAAALSVTLPDGRVLRADRQRIARDDARGRRSWVGTFKEQPGSIVAITTYRGATTGFVTYGAETWELLPGPSGQQLLFRVDDTRLPAAEPVLFPDAAPGEATTSDLGTGGAAADAAGGYVHDLLVVYTPAARAAHGETTLQSMIQNAVAAANQAYQNSGIALTLNLVGLQEVAYVESGAVHTSLYELTGTAEGKMDAVHAVRDSVGADLVTLVSQDNDACGVAWAMRSESASFATNAFSVVNPGCLSQHTLAHELGHNQGNMHDRGSTTSTGAFPYSYGFRRCTTDGTGFRTVMSYSCSGADRVAWFSSPDAYYNGFATGIAYEADPANAADNARSMNNTADTVAAFRAAGGGAATSPAAPSALSATATSSSSVTVRWTDNSGDETGFRLERSTNGVDFTEVATLGAGTTSHSDHGLAALTAYYYRVRAYNGDGNSAYSNTASITTPGDTAAAPAQPLGVVAADNADGSATVSWVDGSANETGFEVRREKWDAKRTTWTGLTTVGSVPSGVTALVDVTNAGTFRYTVRAVSSGGGSAYAGPAVVTVTGGTARTKGRR